MPLGFLAKDSIADLQAFAARSDASATVGGSNEIGLRISEVESSAKSPEDVEVSTANPQQAQEEDHPTSSSAYAPQQRGPGIARESASSTLASSATSSSDLQQRPTLYHSGFDSYSKDYYYHETYSSMYLGEKTERKGFWDCVFPCLFPKYTETDYNNELSQPSPGAADLPTESYPDGFAPPSYSTSPDEAVRSSTSRDDDEVSTNSDLLGERLSDKERQAVLARLRLAQPDTAEGSNTSLAAVDVEEVKTAEGAPAASYSKSPLSQRGLLNGIPAYDTSPLLSQDNVSVLPPPPKLTRPAKGILKRRNAASKDVSATGKDQRPGLSFGGTPQPPSRRFLFPSYETTVPRKINANVSFAPMARVVTVKTRNEMAQEEKADVWFQKPDYEDFRKTGRIITKAMLEGGSEIWLTTSIKSKSSAHGGTTKQGEDKTNPAKNSAPGNKWWHKFGHSRRGLEHIVSFEEGRQRQTNVRNAIHAVLEEQSRQRRYRREDSEKLRVVSLNNTNWARDLALAAGASDADAVQCAFAEDRKSREFYLLKIARAGSTESARRIPEFMNPAFSPKLPTSPRPTAAMKAQRLDENTAVQIRYRQDQQRQENSPAATAVSTPASSSQEEESSEPIRDPNPDVKRNSMAQRAKGFISEGAGKVDMSAVLSGLGAVTQESAAVTT